MKKEVITIAVLGSLMTANTQAAPRFTTERHAYTRGETAALQVKDDATDAFDAVSFDVGGWLPQKVAAKNGQAEYSLNTSLLRAGDYDVRAQPLRGGQPQGKPVLFTLTIAPERNPQRYPVWNWFMGESPNLPWWRERGFNGFRLGALRDPLDPNGETAKKWARILDESVRLGVDMGPYLYPLISTRWDKEETMRVLYPDGKRDPKKAYPLHPEVMAHARATAKSWSDRFSSHPGFAHALLSSEYSTPFDMSETTKRIVKEETGFDLNEMIKPEWAVSGYAVILPDKIPEAWRSKNGLIADDNPMYRFMQWWWQRGHGTNPQNAAMTEILKTGRPDVQTWHDPYRLAPVSGSHSGVDIISTWTYGQPDIKKLAYTTVLQAAARRDNKKVMQTITLYLYSRFATPMGGSTANLQTDQPGRDQPYTQGPDFTREAMWLVLSQRPDILGFYFGGSLTPDNSRTDPFINSPETFDAIGEISRAVVEPYGPTILESRRTPARVAVLLSAASSWFHNGNRHAGYANEMIMPMCSLLMMNHVPFEVVLDDDVAEGRLSNYDMLIMPRADTLTEKMHAEIVKFAGAGKKVLADKTLRAPVPGATTIDLDFSFWNSVDGKALAEGTAVTFEDWRTRTETMADQLKPLLADIARPARSDSKRVVVNSLDSGAVRYVFAINDDKTLGPRFGEHKIFAEAGVRQNAKMFVAAEGRSVLYDALARKRIEAETQNGQFEFSVSLPPARGNLIAALPERIASVEVTLPTEGTRGQKVALRVRVLGESGKAIAGALPLRVEIFDALGRVHPLSRYVSTANAANEWGYSLDLQPALNDEPGEWQVRVTDLLGGMVANAKLTVS